jgi:hypothetical protein
MPYRNQLLLSVINYCVIDLLSDQPKLSQLRTRPANPQAQINELSSLQAPVKVIVPPVTACLGSPDRNVPHLILACYR